MYYTKKSLHFSCVECVTLQIPFDVVFKFRQWLERKKKNDFRCILPSPSITQSYKDFIHSAHYL